MKSRRNFLKVLKILNVPPSSRKSKEKPTKIFLGFEKVNLEVVLSYGMSSMESLREMS